jgi:AcrR family transcriptional regulator
VIDAAMTAFAKRGFHASSMRQLAAEVGATPAALWRHFESKEDLLAAVLEKWSELSAEFGSVREEGVDRILSQHGVMEFHTRNPGLLLLFIAMAADACDESHPAREFMVPRYDRIVHMFAEGLVQASERGLICPMSADVAVAEARQLVAVMDGLEIQWFLNPEIDLVAIFDDYLASAYTRWTNARPPTLQPPPPMTKPPPP